MIYLKRPEEVPEILASDEVETARREAKAFFGRSRDHLDAGTRAQERHEFAPRLWRRVAPPLATMFHHKCAYCETPLLTGGHVDHFRPKIHAADLDGASTTPDHYWWLAYEWRNLYFCCQFCNQNKRNLFPVHGGERARPWPESDALSEQLRTERAMLLDPCRGRDDPAGRLFFDQEGHVHARPCADDEERFADVTRGQVTIDVLGLNRRGLVEDRRTEARALEHRWDDLLLAVDSGDGERIAEVSGFLKDARGDDQPFAGMKRDLLRQWMDEAKESGKLPAIVLSQLKAGFEDSALGSFAREFFGKARRSAPRRGTAKGTSAPVLRRDRRLPAGNIDHIEIRNFRSIRALDLDLRPKTEPKNAAPGSPWKVLLGENGTGKSSVLQAVSLALVGQTQARQVLKKMRIEPKNLRRRWVDGKGNVRTATRAMVRVRLSTGEEIELTADKSSIRFGSGGLGINTLVRAYGATRLLPDRLPGYRHGRAPAGNISAIKRHMRQIHNLFSPGVPLADANAWMLEQRGEAFSPIGLAVKDLLDIDPETGSVHPFRGRIWVDLAGTRARLEELSDGYQSVLALGVDIMAGIPHDLFDMQQATGIVLLDEIGAHLHPRWRMAFVDRLRRAFKGIQFLCTTHEPLCLRGLLPGEIVVIRRDADHEIQKLTDLPDVRYMRVDQLLTSKLFGLLTAMDEKVEGDFEEYYTLLSRDRSPEDDVRLEELRVELDGKDLLGSTRRERLLYRAIDQMMAEEATRGRPSAVGENAADPLDAEVRERLLRIWDEV